MDSYLFWTGGPIRSALYQVLKRLFAPDIQARISRLERFASSDEGRAFADRLVVAARAGKITLSATLQQIEPYSPQAEYDQMLLSYPESE